MNAVEIELKLCLKPGTSLTRFFDLAWLQVLPTHQQFLKTQYFDTPQADFHQQRMALRIRHEADQYIQTLKRPTVNSTDLLQCCTEWHSVLTQAIPDCSRIPDAVLSADVMNLIAGNPLLEVFNTQFTRHTWLYASHDSEVEIALDEGFIESQGQCEKIFEIELELKQGSNKQVLYDLADLIGQVIEVLPTCASKAKRGYALAALSSTDLASH